MLFSPSVVTTVLRSYSVNIIIIILISYRLVFVRCYSGTMIVPTATSDSVIFIIWKIKIKYSRHHRPPPLIIYSRRGASLSCRCAAAASDASAVAGGAYRPQRRPRYGITLNTAAADRAIFTHYIAADAEVPSVSGRISLSLITHNLIPTPIVFSLVNARRVSLLGRPLSGTSFSHPHVFAIIINYYCFLRYMFLFIFAISYAYPVLG